MNIDHPLMMRADLKNPAAALGFSGILTDAVCKWSFLKISRRVLVTNRENLMKLRCFLPFGPHLFVKRIVIIGQGVSSDKY